jgi:hypothetical protein
MLIGGGLFIVGGIAVLGMVVWQWQMRDFAATYSVVPAVIGTLCVTLGFQNVLGGFLLSIVGGNEAQFMAPHNAPAKAGEQISIAA